MKNTRRNIQRGRSISVRRFWVLVPVTSGVQDVEDVTLEITDLDAEDLNAGLSITGLTTQGEEVEIFPEESL